MNSNNTTSIEELENNFFEKKCQLIEKAGDNQLVIVNFVDIEDLISEAYTQGVIDTIKRVEGLEKRNEDLKELCDMWVARYYDIERENIKLRKELTELSSMKEKGMK